MGQDEPKQMKQLITDLFGMPPKQCALPILAAVLFALAVVLLCGCRTKPDPNETPQVKYSEVWS